jgi:hypothetical protein
MGKLKFWDHFKSDHQGTDKSLINRSKQAGGTKLMPGRLLRRMRLGSTVNTGLSICRKAPAVLSSHISWRVSLFPRVETASPQKEAEHSGNNGAREAKEEVQAEQY